MTRAIDRIIDSLTAAEVEAIAERFMRAMRNCRNYSQQRVTASIELNEIYDDVIVWTEDRIQGKAQQRIAA